MFNYRIAIKLPGDKTFCRSWAGCGQVTTKLIHAVGYETENRAKTVADSLQAQNPDVAFRVQPW
jgi:hypothetical protein